jgi:hypothetical protein
MQDDGSGKAGMLREGAMDIPISQADTVRLFAHLIERMHRLEEQLEDQRRDLDDVQILIDRESLLRKKKHVRDD